MFLLAFIIGIYGYLFFALGLFGLLYKQIITIVIISLFFVFTPFLGTVVNYLKTNFKTIIKIENYNLLSLIILLLIILQVVINLIGALGPELSFDSLWYHLTLPKLYLINHSVFYISGGLLYYSAMPKLTEMFYLAALTLQGEILAKFIHFLFGVFTLIALYKVSRKFFSKEISLIVILTFYSNFVVAWESVTAYVDLARTFFETMALWGFINWWETNKKKWLLESAILVGLAISTKFLAVGSLFIFTALIIYKSFLTKKIFKETVLNISIFWIISILIILPWCIFSYINTGNPVYPFFSNIYKINVGYQLINPFNFIIDIWNMLSNSSDPISPLYLIFLPLTILFYKRFKLEFKMIVIYTLLALIIWYFTPRTGGGRFVLPYLPAFSLVLGITFREAQKIKMFKIFLIGLILFISLITIVYRSAANMKYLPFILGKESKNEFLSKNLNFDYGDFYDIDDYFKRNIKPEDTVLLYGFHNLYYVDFPYIDSSWIKKGDKFNYVAVQSTSLPERFRNWSLIYYNKKTDVKLYSSEKKICVY